jgi:hypothetical protein
VALAAHAGVMANGRPRALKMRGLRVRVSPPAPVPGGLMASHQGSEPWSRWFDPSPGSFASVAQWRSSVFVRRRTQDRYLPEALGARTPTGREARSRAWMLRVQIPPSAPRRRARLRPGPCKAGDPGRHRMAALFPGWLMASRPVLETGARWFESSPRNMPA